MHHKQNLSPQGFTLIELLVTLTIGAILMSLAAPSFSTLVKGNRITSSVNQLTATLYFARSEAIKRGQNVRVCVSANATSCATTGDWTQGWLVFEDKNGNRSIDAGEEIIRIHKALSNQLKVTGNGSISLGLSYTPRGRLTPSTNSSIKVCDDRVANDYGRKIIIVRTGRFRIGTPETEGTITCP